MQAERLAQVRHGDRLFCMPPVRLWLIDLSVVWKVSPLFAGWISSPGNLLFHHSTLGLQSVVLELGCGISGIVGITLAPKVGRYIATDQDYVMKLLKRNIEESSLQKEVLGPRKRRNQWSADEPLLYSRKVPEVMSLDWELDSVSSLPTLLQRNGGDAAVTCDALVACDCIYNEALVDPFVHTCAEICRLRAETDNPNHTICIIAQQLRSSIVFEAWLCSFFRSFHVWRIPDGMLTEELKSTSGFVVHVGILRVHKT